MEYNHIGPEPILAQVRDILGSPCAAFLAEWLGPDGVERYGPYEDMTDRQRELSAQEIALVSKYDALAWAAETGLIAR